MADQRAQPMPKKAYKVSTDCGDYSVVVFAETSGQAKVAALGTDWFTYCEFTELNARREPAFDAYQDADDIPLQTYLENGWEWDCADCGDLQRIDIHDIGGVNVKGEGFCISCAKKRGLTPPAWARPHEDMEASDD